VIGAKRLQVFVSSTYHDLQEERQAAVEAILTAGHIPAGMELFTAGDQSQLTVIRRWIEESDVFLLILGGRYGSVEAETQKSYIHLEYDYAIEQGKPFFAIVVDEETLDKKLKRRGRSVIETDNPQKLREFRTQVLTRLVRFWSDPRDIKLAIHETMSEFERRRDLAGWVPGSQLVDAGVLAEEIARLTRENAQLRAHLASASTTGVVYNGLNFEQMYQLLTNEENGVETLSDEARTTLGGIAKAFGDPWPGPLHFFWYFRERFGHDNNSFQVDYPAIKPLETAGLIAPIGNWNPTSKSRSYQLTETGRQFLLKLLLERGTPEAKALKANKK
jgi:hypothetical protein